jgi:prenyltransferase beta subunit
LECEKDHKNHKIIKYENIPLDDHEIKVFRNKLNQFNEKIPVIMEEFNKILNEINTNMEIYYSIIDNILKMIMKEIF